MARIRTIKPDFFLDDDLCELSPLHRLLFAGLWTLADCEGRLEDKPKKIHIQILPYDKCDVDRMLSDLSAKRSNGHSFIRRYSVDGSGYIQIPNFRKHQRISGKEAQLESGYPPPTEGSIGEAIGKQSGSISAIPESQEGKGREGKGMEGNGMEVERKGGMEGNQVFPFKEILDDLNSKIGSRYTATPKHKELISARLKEGHSIEDFRIVHSKMIEAWGNDQKMREFLRPITLYSTKFESYLNRIGRQPIDSLSAEGKETLANIKEWVEESNGRKG